MVRIDDYDDSDRTLYIDSRGRKKCKQDEKKTDAAYITIT